MDKFNDQIPLMATLSILLNIAYESYNFHHFRSWRSSSCIYRESKNQSVKKWRTSRDTSKETIILVQPTAFIHSVWLSNVKNNDKEWFQITNLDWDLLIFCSCSVKWVFSVIKSWKLCKVTWVISVLFVSLVMRLFTSSAAFWPFYSAWSLSFERLSDFWSLTWLKLRW